MTLGKRKIIEGILIMAGEIALGIIEPWAKPYKGTGNILEYPVKDLRKTLEQFKRNTFDGALKRLNQRGLITFSYKKGIKHLRLTKKGLDKIKRLIQERTIDNIKIAKPKKWHGHWRVVISDIPDSKKSTRDILRETLKRLGFYHWQKSVFVHPFASLEQIEAIRTFYDVKKYVKIISTDYFEDDGEIRRFFGL